MLYFPKILKNLKPVFSILSILVYCFLLFWVTGLVFESFTDLVPLSRAKTSFYFEPIVLFITFSCIVILTRRIVISLIVLTGLYLTLMLINAEMMKVFGLMFSPGDIKHSIQVFLAPEIWLSYWKKLVFIFFLFLILVTLIIKTKPNKFLHKHRVVLFSLLTVSYLVVYLNHYKISSKIKKEFRLYGKVVPRNLPEKHGFLFAFYYQLLKKEKIEEPDNYSKESIERIVSKYSEESTDRNQIKPNVIIFFIEAFSDPRQMGIETSYDSIPNFRKYSQQGLSGLVLSPEIGGRSANPEFELLTGLSMRFVPEKSIPYIDYINKPFPSIANEFKANGYTSHAIHVATMSFFNYKKAYRFLGFDYFYTLLDRDAIEKDIQDRFPSENALVDEIINITEANDTPQFIFSFPNSTHGFWDYDAYLDSDLEVFGDYINDGNNHIKTYINAIHTADKAVGKLINHYAQDQKPTIVMVLGDHQPSLPEFRQSLAIEYFKKQRPDKTFKSRKQLKRQFGKQLRKNFESDNPLIADVYRKSHQVPYLIWNNFDNSPDLSNTSMNLLASPLLSISQVNKTPLFNLIDEIYSNIQELHKKSIIGKEYKQLINEYKLLQYDVLAGNQYYKQYIDTE